MVVMQGIAAGEEAAGDAFELLTAPLLWVARARVDGMSLRLARLVVIVAHTVDAVARVVVASVQQSAGETFSVGHRGTGMTGWPSSIRVHYTG